MEEKDTNREELEQIAMNLPPKMLGYTLIQDAGLKKTECAQILGISNGRVSQIDRELQQWGLKNLKMVRLAHNVVKNVLKGMPQEQARRAATKDGQVIDYIDNIYPTHTNQLQAATMVYDRVEPVRKDTDTSTSAPVCPVSINVLFGGSQAPQVAVSVQGPGLPKSEV
jgi:hypothetical protein